jgi:hypothetical protein
MSKMEAEVGGFQGVPTDCQLMVAKLVMQRQQLETVHHMIMPREFRNAIRKGWYKAINQRLCAREWSVQIKDRHGNTPVQHCLLLMHLADDEEKVPLRNVLSVLLQHGGKPAETYKILAPDMVLTTSQYLASDTKTMRLLVQAGLKTKVLYNYALKAKRKPYDRAYVQFLMQTIKPDNDECNIALYFATQDNEVSLNNVQLLLEEGCDRGLQVSEFWREYLLDNAKEENEAVHALLCAELAKLNEEPPAKRVKTN